MKRKPIIFVIIISILIAFIYGYEKGKNDETTIERLKYTDREKLLQRSEGIDGSYFFKINNLESRSTYQFKLWSEHYNNGKLVNELEILDQPRAFVIGEKDTNGYIILSIKQFSNSLNCTLSREKHYTSMIISGYRKESFKYRGVTTAMKETKASSDNDILLLASANGENSSFGIRVDREKKIIEEDIKKNDEVYLIKCKLLKIRQVHDRRV